MENKRVLSRLERESIWRFVDGLRSPPVGEMVNQRIFSARSTRSLNDRLS